MQNTNVSTYFSDKEAQDKAYLVIENRSSVIVGYLFIALLYFILGAIGGGLLVWLLK